MESKNSYSDEDIQTTFQRLNKKADILYRFVLLYSDYINRPHDYGNGQVMSMTEAHILSAIDRSPGITVTELAKIWNRTKGAVSQTVSRLERRGLVKKEQKEDNRKTILLYTTEKGRQCSLAHELYDIRGLTGILENLSRHCTMEEINAFYKVAEVYSHLFTETP